MFLVVCCFCFTVQRYGNFLAPQNFLSKIYIFRLKIGLKTLILSFTLYKCSKTYAKIGLKMPVLRQLYIMYAVLPDCIDISTAAPYPTPRRQAHLTRTRAYMPLYIAVDGYTAEFGIFRFPIYSSRARHRSILPYPMQSPVPPLAIPPSTSAKPQFHWLKRQICSLYFAIQHKNCGTTQVLLQNILSIREKSVSLHMNNKQQINI